MSEPVEIKIGMACSHTPERPAAVQFEGRTFFCQCNFETHRAKLAAKDREIKSLTESKNTAYSERNWLVCALSKCFPSHLCRHPESDTEWENDWRWIVCVHGPTGQMTWHIHDSERSMFHHLPVSEQHWDGHSTEEKYRRLEALNPSDPEVK